MESQHLQCNAEILFALREYGEVRLPNWRATNFKLWLKHPTIRFNFEFTEGKELTTIKNPKTT